MDVGLATLLGGICLAIGALIGIVLGDWLRGRRRWHLEQRSSAREVLAAWGRTARPGSDLRHTHATLALAAGIHPKVVQERLGHSSITVTMDTYSHAIPAMQSDAAARIAAIVDGG